jgi:voltage-gated potassium channel
MKSWRDTLHEVIFEADTPAGKAFDVGLLWLILLSVLTVLLESVPELQSQYQVYFYFAEWVFTCLFTLEYALRLMAVRKPVKYATSFFGIVDLLAILPTFIGLLIPGSASLRVVRILRLLRMFRVLKLAGFLEAATAR